MTEKEEFAAIIGGLAGFLPLVVIAFAGGATFGQRCAAAGYERGTAEFSECLERLNRGGGV